MSRMFALAALLVAAPLAAQDFDVHALYEKWKAEESRTMDGWRALDDDTLIEKLTPLAGEWDAARNSTRRGKPEANALAGICFRFGVGGAPKDWELARQYLHEDSPLPDEVGWYLLHTESGGIRIGSEIRGTGGVRTVGGRLAFNAPWSPWEFWNRTRSEFAPEQLLCALTQLSDRDDTRRENAVTNLQLAAKAECLPAMVFLARYQTQGVEIARDVNAAQAWLEKAAAAQYTPALMELATFHHPQDGARPDLKRYREVLLAAAELGEINARVLLRALPEKPVDELTVDELFQQFITEWPVFTTRKSRFGGNCLCSEASPVLARYADVARWLRPFADPPKLDATTAPVAYKAQCMLGICLAHGIGGAKQDRQQALSLLRSAADVGGLGAALLLYAEHALALDQKHQVMAFEDELLASSYYQGAVDTGFAPASRFQAEVSLDWARFDYGKVFQLDTEKKFKLSRDAAIAQLVAFADKSDVEACRLLIQHFNSESETEHRKWVVKGANLGDPGSMLALAEFYAKGEWPPPKEDSAQTLYQRCLRTTTDPRIREAAEEGLRRLTMQPGIARAEALIVELEASLTKHGEFMAFLKDHPGIAGLAQRAFQANEDTGALYGLCLMNGHGISLNLTAARRALLAAEDSMPASFLYGWLSEQEFIATGWGIRSAVWTYEAVANMGGVYAAYRLGVIQSNKDGDYFSREKAYSWFSQAAEGGCLPAMVALAKAYKNGLGVAADEAKAKEWAKKAADEGDEAASSLLEEWK